MCIYIFKFMGRGGSLLRPPGATAPPSFNINIILGMIDQVMRRVAVVMRSHKPFYVPSSTPWHPLFNKLSEFFFSFFVFNLKKNGPGVT
jgi:hypothetical protein